MTATTAKVFSNARVFTSKEGDNTLYDTLVTQGDKVVYVGDRAGADKALGQVCCSCGMAYVSLQSRRPTCKAR